MMQPYDDMARQDKVRQCQAELTKIEAALKAKKKKRARLMLILRNEQHEEIVSSLRQIAKGIAGLSNTLSNTNAEEE